MSRIRPSRLIGLLALFIAVYLALFWAARTSGALLGAERAMAAAATATLAVFSRPDILRTVEVDLRDSESIVYDFTLAARGEIRQALGKHPFHAHNLVLFAALALASPRLRRSIRFAALFGGLAAIFAVDVLIVMGDLLSMEDRGFEIAGQDNVWGPLKLLCAVLRYSQPTGGAFMVPIFVWALLLAAPFGRDLLQYLQGSAASPEGGS